MKDRIAKAFRRYVSGGVGSLSKEVQEGYRRHGGASGAESAFAFIPERLAEKALGKERVRNALWKIQKPALSADMIGGRMARDMAWHVLPRGWANKAFKVTEKVPLGDGLHKDVKRLSLTAPLSHAKGLAVPIIVGSTLEKGVRSLQKNHHETRDVNQGKEKKRQALRALIDSAALKKVAEASHVKVELSTDGPMDKQRLKTAAATMLRLHSENKKHEKRAHAERLIYKQAELGFLELPRTFGEWEQKLASLMDQDLAVVEMALELSGGNLKFGELGSLDSSKPTNATEAFQAAIIGE